MYSLVEHASDDLRFVWSIGWPRSGYGMLIEFCIKGSPMRTRTVKRHRLMLGLLWGKALWHFHPLTSVFFKLSLLVLCFFFSGSCYPWGVGLSPQCVQCPVPECKRPALFCSVPAIWAPLQSAFVPWLPACHATATQLGPIGWVGLYVLCYSDLRLWKLLEWMTCSVFGFRWHCIQLGQCCGWAHEAPTHFEDWCYYCHY